MVERKSSCILGRIWLSVLWDWERFEVLIICVQNFFGSVQNFLLLLAEIPNKSNSSHETDSLPGHTYKNLALRLWQ